MFRPRPFGKSYSDVITRPGKRMSAANWERLFTTRKRTLMDKANKLAHDAACFITLTVKSPAGETWFYATTDELRKALFKSGLINTSSIQVTRETLDQNLLLQGNICNPNYDTENIPNFQHITAESLPDESIKRTKKSTIPNAPTLIQYSSNVKKSNPPQSSTTKKKIASNISENSTQEKSNEKQKKNFSTSESNKNVLMGKKSQAKDVPSSHHPFVMPQSAKNSRATTNFDEINNNIRSGNHTFFTDENLESELQKTRKKTATMTSITPTKPESGGGSESSSETSSSSDSDSDDSSSSSGDSSSSSDSDASSKDSENTTNSLQTTTTVTTVFKKEHAVDSIAPFPRNATSISGVKKIDASVPAEKEKVKITNTTVKTSLKSGNRDTSKSNLSNDAERSQKKDATIKEKKVTKTAVVKPKVQTKSGNGAPKETSKSKKSSGKNGNDTINKPATKLAKNNSEDKTLKVKKPVKKVASEKSKNKKSELSGKESSEKNTDKSKSKDYQKVNLSTNAISDKNSRKNIPILKEIKREYMNNKPSSDDTNPYHFTSNLTPKKSIPTSDRRSKSPHMKRSLEKDDFSQSKGPVKRPFICDKMPDTEISQSKEPDKKTFTGDNKPNYRYDKGHGVQHTPQNDEYKQRNRSRSPWNKSPHDYDISRRKRCHSFSSDHRSQYPDKNDEFQWKRQRFEEHDQLFQNRQFSRNEPLILNDRHGSDYWDVHQRNPWERHFVGDRLNRTDFDDRLRNIANYDKWEADILAGWSSGHDFPHRTMFRNERETLHPKTPPSTFHRIHKINKNTPQSRYEGKNIQHQTLLPETQGSYKYGKQENKNMQQPRLGDKSMPRPKHHSETAPRPLLPELNRKPWQRYRANGNALLSLPQEQDRTKNRFNDQKAGKNSSIRKSDHTTLPRQQASTNGHFIDKNVEKNIPDPKPKFFSPRRQASKKERFSGKNAEKNSHTPKHTFFTDTEGTKDGVESVKNPTFFMDTEGTKGIDDSVEKNNFNKKSAKKSPRVNYRRKFRTSNQGRRRKTAPVAQVKPFNQENNKHSYNNRR